MIQNPSNNQRRDERGGGRKDRDRARGREGRPFRGGERSTGRTNDRGPYRGNRNFDGYHRDRDRGPGERDSNRDHSDRSKRFKKPEGDEDMRRHGEPGVEITGRTVDDAALEAGRRFGVSRDQMKIQVVSKGSKGFLGFLGTKPATIRVQLTSGATQNYAEVVLNKILKDMGLPDRAKPKKDPDGNLVLDIHGPSSGVLIGRHGQTLESLQYIVSKILQRVTSDDKALVIVDVESYRERQNDKLRELALSMAAKARETLRPMNARDRRIVHMTLKDDREVTTQSQGEGLRRRVVVIPKNKKESAPPVEKQPETPPAQAPDASPVAPEEPAGLELDDTEDEGASEPAPDPNEPGNAAPPPDNELDDDAGNR
jgi:spoIIIJ-associated protein